METDEDLARCEGLGFSELQCLITARLAGIEAEWEEDLPTETLGSCESRLRKAVPLEYDEVKRQLEAWKGGEHADSEELVQCRRQHSTIPQPIKIPGEGKPSGRHLLPPSHRTMNSPFPSSPGSLSSTCGSTREPSPDRLVASPTSPLSPKEPSSDGLRKGRPGSGFRRTRGRMLHSHTKRAEKAFESTVVEDASREREQDLEQRRTECHLLPNADFQDCFACGDVPTFIPTTPITLDGEKAFQARVLPEGMLDPVTVALEGFAEMESRDVGKTSACMDLDAGMSRRQRMQSTSVQNASKHDQHRDHRKMQPEEDEEDDRQRRTCGRNWRGVHRAPASLAVGRDVETRFRPELPTKPGTAPACSGLSVTRQCAPNSRPCTGPGTRRARQLGCAEGLSTQYSCRSEAWWNRSSARKVGQCEYIHSTLASQQPDWESPGSRQCCSCDPTVACEHWPSGRSPQATNLPKLPGAEGGKADGLGLSLQPPVAKVPAWLQGHKLQTAAQ
eukprot:TRINITY_DN27939_c0_g1_i1.p1 TRINITY_DN27939_c0_g1~~TRINITY_DN27939_c0_g1_i1.p1  ORF type:complete len:503 (-),score=79.87 TRINITY_DN27939_c0_g1_i1:160-1668(-)